ncbi:MAG: protein kinase [Deltaproteobacteria bacterium]|nr:protein kinase [Deltaproteobacteria bacterium]
MTRDGRALDADTLDAEGGGRVAGVEDASGLFADRYRIERLIGRGGMGAVYKARDELLGEAVAIKVVDLGDAPQPSTVERLRREVRLARRVTHPNVARTHDVGEWRGRHFLTMELVEGTDLEAVLEREKALAPARAISLAIGIAEGLAAAHAAGIVHRDLKPANVLVANDQRVLLTDFGIAKSLADATGMSRTTGTMGTLLYMAPEQVRGLAGDGRTDVYAFGLVLYEMLSGTYPFLESTAIATALARLDRDAPELKTRAPIDDELSSLVHGCLARSPEDRPQSMTEIATALRAWLVRHAAGSIEIAQPTIADMRTPPGGGALLHPRTPSSPTSDSGSLGTRRSLAVLPFRYHGPAELAHLGETLADEVIDALSRTRGMRVLASGVASRFGGDRDPRRVGTELGVHAVVDGTVHCRVTVGAESGDAGEASLRVAARLIDVATGAVLASERFESQLRDVLGAQDAMSRRIAEAMRVSLALGVERDEAPGPVVECYLRARHALTTGKFTGVGGAMDLLDECLQQAPTYRPAIAAYALAAARGWFLARGSAASDSSPAETAAAAIDRALALAGDFPETQLACAVQHVQRAELAEAARALARALAIAPNYAAAHAYLGMLLVEAGRHRAGMKHLVLARDLEPIAPFATIQIARSHALAGRWTDYEQTMAGVVDPDGTLSLPIRLRVAAWRGRSDEVRSVHAILRTNDSPIARLLDVYARSVLGDPSATEQPWIAELELETSPRFRLVLAQALAEVQALTSDVPRALRALARAVDRGLADLEWIEGCPALATIRGTPELEEATRAVRTRADAIATAAGV